MFFISQPVPASSHSLSCQKALPVTPHNREEQTEPTLTDEHKSSSVRQICSEDLLAGTSEIQIRHGNEVYRLRITRAGKLILTK